MIKDFYNKSYNFKYKENYYNLIYLISKLIFPFQLLEKKIIAYPTV